MKRVAFAAVIVGVIVTGCSTNDGSADLADRTNRAQAPGQRSEEQRPNYVRVPDVVGVPFAEAKKELRLVGLAANPGTLSRRPSTVESQQPSHGQRVAMGSVVRLDVR